ncbi:MAG: EAL domain-containing protein [Rhizobiaceae bacterium]
MSIGPIRARTRLAGLVWPFVTVALAQAAIAGVSLYTLSSVRGYVGGESLWSKGQKDAIYSLDIYAQTGHLQYYRKFETAIAVPLADRAARLALEAETPDVDAAARGFAGGRIHPDDIPGLIWLFQTFRHVSYLDRAIHHWEVADPVIVELDTLAREIRSGYENGEPAAGDLKRWKERIYLINERIAPLSKAFSDALGEGSRAIKDILLVVNIVTAALLILLAVWRTRKLLNQRTGMERALNAERERAQITLGSIGQAVISTDRSGRIDYMNAAAERLLGVELDIARGEMLPRLCRLADAETGTENRAIVDMIINGAVTGQTFHAQRVYRLDGSSVPVSLVGAPLIVEGQVRGSVLVFYDLTREQEYIARLTWQASHDALTLLANRREFEERLGRAIERANHTECQHALMLLDLDQFKIINDTGGHEAGDHLLRQVATTLSKELRPGDLLARFGGDEFCVLLENCTTEEATMTAERLRTAMQKLCFVWNDRPFTTSTSIGLVHIDEAGLTVEGTLRAADVACYMAKEKGRNRVQIHHPTDSELLQRFEEMAWVQRIHAALEADRFELHYQEIVPLDGSGGARHVELLLRLRDETGRLVPPGTFIPAAERYGLMPKIDRWVVGRAFDVLSRAPHGAITTCAINLSGITFGDEGFVGFVEERFRRTGVRPSTICFEITETSAIANLSSAMCFIEAMQRLGCRFSLDDFGSGMSSFAYLKHLPVDYLKIDGGFVKDLLDDRIDRAMVEMINHIGHVTGKKTIAEFVENTDIAAALRDIGVDFAQGFGISAMGTFDNANVASMAPGDAVSGESVSRSPATPRRQATG